MTAPGGTPARDKLQLRLALRDARTKRKLTQKDVADAMEWSTSKLVRIEGGNVGISVTDLKALLFQYEITDEAEVGRFVELARAAKKAAWWQPYRDYFPPEFITFLGLEASSIRLRQFQQLVVPGLLQAPEYIRVLMQLGSPPPEQQERGFAIRTQRQKLIADGGPEMFFIIDESVLFRQIGDQSVMRAQLLHLKELAARSNISIRILPFSVGVHPGMRESFEIFELSEESSNYALQIEGILRDRLFPEPSSETARYVDIFFRLEKLALPKEETPGIIDERLRHMT
ncbi:transcriptional regulator [Kibdelosporangium aridum]|uniref:Transcriptional regulator n=1 Tax=Kibdelosporangium aridum TaxID=2030 RepID=A0A428ZAC2_KIBAR|nr:helix-turn-helix transcriptional regulator [Kibdelosporangium aridum]RSM85027.1 transcriptional regulator [Kibdelosporangium aridum]